MRLAYRTMPERRPVFEHDERQYLPRLEQLESVSRVSDGGWVRGSEGSTGKGIGRRTQRARHSSTHSPPGRLLSEAEVHFGLVCSTTRRTVVLSRQTTVCWANKAYLSLRIRKHPFLSKRLCVEWFWWSLRCQSSAEREQSSRRSSEGEV